MAKANSETTFTLFHFMKSSITRGYGRRLYIPVLLTRRYINPSITLYANKRTTSNLSANIQMFAVSVLSSRPVIWLLRRVGFMLNTDQGSWTQLFAIAGRGFNATLSGTYLEPIAKKGTVKMPQGVTSEDLQNRLWKWTEREMKAKGFISWSMYPYRRAIILMYPFSSFSSNLQLISSWNGS